MTTFIDTSDNFHPYECNGPGHCIHCNRTVSDTHDPKTCALCDEEDGMGALSEQADAIDAIAGSLTEDQGALAGELGDVSSKLRDYATAYGDEQSAPTAAEVSAGDEPDPDANTETTPEEGDELPEGATVVENEPGAE